MPAADKEPPIPKGEKAWVGFYNSSGECRYIVTSKKNLRDLYYLYENDGEKYIKIDKNKDPLVLCNKHNIYEKIKEK